MSIPGFGDPRYPGLGTPRCWLAISTDCCAPVCTAATLYVSLLAAHLVVSAIPSSAARWMVHARIMASLDAQYMSTDCCMPVCTAATLDVAMLLAIFGDVRRSGSQDHRSRCLHLGCTGCRAPSAGHGCNDDTSVFKDDSMFAAIAATIGPSAAHRVEEGWRGYPCWRCRAIRHVSVYIRFPSVQTGCQPLCTDLGTIRRSRISAPQPLDAVIGRRSWHATHLVSNMLISC